MLGTEPFSLVALAIDYLLFLKRKSDSRAVWKNELQVVHNVSSVKIVARRLYDGAVACRDSHYRVYVKYSNSDHHRVSASSFFNAQLNVHQ